MTGRQDQLSRIPNELLVKVVHVDDSIIVISKPANLRSVPGHANPPPSLANQQRDGPTTSSSSETASRNAQDCWIKAVKSFVDVAATASGRVAPNDERETMVLESLARLANTKTVDSVPRKWKSFLRHVQRYQKQILPITFHHHGSSNRNVTSTARETLETLAREMFQQIGNRYRPLLQLPEPSPLEDSAMGQLILMGYGDHIAGSGPPPSADTPQLYAVHRLDCETSGVMVFARNESAASILSQAWRREGDGCDVTKIYWAMVAEWPPFQLNQETQGRIDLPLASSTTERLKWQVQMKGGKPSTTLWRVLPNSFENFEATNSAEQKMDVVRDVEGDSLPSSANHLLMELTPLTGRTHQLRIHCAHVGSGIVGDSLYGKNPVPWTSSGNNQLCLHAYNLRFPHPTTGKQVEFSYPPPWSQEN